MSPASRPEAPLVSRPALREHATAARRQAAALCDASLRLQAIACAERERAERNMRLVADAMNRWVGSPVFGPPPGDEAEG